MSLHQKHRNTHGNAFAVLHDDGGLVLTLMKGDPVSYPNTFHIGFIQKSEERVNEINQQMKDDGFEVAPRNGRTLGRSMSRHLVDLLSRFSVMVLLYVYGPTDIGRCGHVLQRLR